MPRTTQIRSALAEIAQHVVGTDPSRVVDNARLREDLGIDSLSVLEVCEALAQRFDTYLADDVINDLTTVAELVNAVDTSKAKPPAAAVSSGNRSHGDTAPDAPEGRATALIFSDARSAHSETVQVGEVVFAKQKAKRWAGGMALIGVIIGLVLGIGVIGVVRVSGITEVELAPVNTPTHNETVTASSSPSPSASPSPTETTESPKKKKKKPTLKAASDQVAPGENIELSGAIPELDRGVSLQVQTKEGDEGWEDFPVSTVTKDKGKFATVIRTERASKREVRLIDKGSGKKTPAVDVTIG